MNKYKKLFGDSIIYLIGNVGSKVISVVMVSFYSFMLMPEDFGKIDVTQTTIALILPFVTLCIHEAVLRFCLKSNYSKAEVLSNGVLILIISIFITIPICLLMDSLNVIGGNIFLIIMLVPLEGFNTLFSQYCRGINKTKIFAIAGMTLTFVIAASNIIFLKYLNLGIDGYFLSMIVGYSISIIILFLGGKVYKNISFKKVNKNSLKIMIKFAIPLIPNSIMWWLMNAADKYVILTMLGTEANGLYAVAGKIPMILSTFTTIFMQAWQVSAISESDAKDKSLFYSKIFNGLSSFIFIAISGILIILKPVLAVAISSNYIDVWKYVPFLLLSTAFSAFSAFLGTNYAAMAKTSGALKTTVIGGVLNLILNFTLIHFIGLNGAAIATAVSFFVVWQLRIRDTKEFVKIKMDVKKFVLSFALISIQILATYLWSNEVVTILGIFNVIIILILNAKLVLYIFHSMLKKRTM